MAITGDLRVSATLPLHRSLPNLHPLFRTRSFPPPKVDFHCFLNGGSSLSAKTSHPDNCTKQYGWLLKPVSGVLGGPKYSPKSVSQEAENFLLDAVNMSFFERLNLAWNFCSGGATSGA